MGSVLLKKKNTIHSYSSNFSNLIGGVMVSVLALSVIDRCPRSGQTEDYRIGICCFSAMHTVLRRKSKDWLDQNQDNVSRVGRHIYPWLWSQGASTITHHNHIIIPLLDESKGILGSSCLSVTILVSGWLLKYRSTKSFQTFTHCCVP